MAAGGGEWSHVLATGHGDQTAGNRVEIVEDDAVLVERYHVVIGIPCAHMGHSADV